MAQHDEQNPHADFFEINTTQGSLAHKLLPYFHGQSINLRLYALAVGIFFIPLLLCWKFGSFTSCSQNAVKCLNMFEDWNMLFIFMFSFPCIFVLTMTDQETLARALKQVQIEKTVFLSSHKAIELSTQWRHTFRWVNICSQLLGLGVGGAIAYFNFVIFSPQDVGHWMSRNDQLNPVGLVYLFGLFFLYCFLTVYVIRNVFTAFLFVNIVRHAEIHILPMHPDKSGGLRPLAEIGLRNQYVVMLLGVNLVTAVTVAYVFLEPPDLIVPLFTAAVTAYLIMGPLVFVAPLLPFRQAMVAAKTRLSTEVAQRIRLELNQLHTKLPSGAITKDEEDFFERLQKMARVIDELPAWPFDASTARKFLVSYVVPILSTGFYPAIKYLFEFFKTNL
jgi:hypothetical protein